MFDQTERQAYCKHHQLPAAGVAYMENLFTSGPSRPVGSRMGNVCGKFASDKMGCTVQFESYTIEFPFLLQAVSSDEVFAVLDQPPQLKLHCQTTTGKRAAFFHTPDYALATRHGPKFVECKPAAKLRELEQKTPWRYRRGDGRWCCPPGEVAAKEFGFGYEVVTDEDLNPQLTANVQFLLDYLSKDHPDVQESIKVRIIEAVRKCFGVTIAELVSQEHGFKPEDIHLLLARRELFFDWEEAPLTKPDKVQVFLDANSAAAHHHASVAPAYPKIPTPHFLNLVVGAEFVWRQRNYKVLNIDPDCVVVVSGKESVPIPRAVFEQYVRGGEIVGLDDENVSKLHEEVQRLLNKAGKDDLAAANRRFAIITDGIPREQVSESDRTLNRWRADYKIAEARYGNGYVGLLPKLHCSGNRRPRFPEKLIELMQRIFQEHFLTKKAKSAKRAHGQLSLECERAGLPTPSQKTWLRFIWKHPKHGVILAREGKRVAYQHESDRPGHHRVDGPEATWPWKKTHLDHTKIDVVTVDKETGKAFERAWLSILWDENSHRILALHLCYDEPSYRSCLAILRECVLRHGRLPESIVVDNGTEFRSVYFETVCALFRVSIFRRPAGQPRYGAGCERTFGILNLEFFHALLGNTKIMKNVRQVTQSVNPRNLAAWTLEDLDEMLCIYAYEIYEHRELPTLHMTPAQTYAQGMAIAGERANRMISYDQDFRTLTMPSTRSGKAKVQVGTGVKVNRIWYWHGEMTEPTIERSDVEVRFDPDDMGHVYARLNGRWVECQSEHYYVFHGRSEREIKFASREIKALHGQHDQGCAVYGKRLAEFLESAENHELILEQRVRDLARRRIQEAHEQKARGGVPVSNASSDASQNCAGDLGSKIIPMKPVKGEFQVEDSPLQVFSEF